MPREGGWREAGKPRDRYQTDAKPQKPSKTLKARQKDYDDSKLSQSDGYRRPGSQRK